MLEGSIAGIDGIDVLDSTSRCRDAAASPSASGSSVDPDVAASDVRDRVSRVRGRLPDEIDEPIIAKVEADAQPIMYPRLHQRPNMTALEITDYVDRYVVDRLKNLTASPT